MPKAAQRETELGINDDSKYPVDTHIASLLSARNRLAEQTLKLPDPEEELSRIANRSARSSYDRRTGIWPGCLEREQLPPGDVYNEPLYKFLFEHTRDDPRWAGLGEWYAMDVTFDDIIKDNSRTSPWWVEYEYSYMNRLYNLFEESYQACQYLCYQASITAGNQSGPMVFFDFLFSSVA